MKSHGIGHYFLAHPARCGIMILKKTSSSMAQTDRWQQRLHNLNKAFDCFERACAIPHPDEVYRAGILHMFQMSFELCWKTLKDKLAYEGIDAASPRDTLKKAFAAGLIETPELWLKALETRNTFTHAYDEEMSIQSLKVITSDYLPLLRSCVNKLNSQASDS